MSITLPTWPRPSETVEPEVIDRDGQTSPATGGKLQTLRRVGDRLKVTVVLPAMAYDDARVWLACKLDSATTGETVVWTWPLAEGEGSSVGAPKVDGADQLGPVLNLKGLTAGTVIKPLTPFSFVAGGRHNLYLTRREATVDIDGKVALPIGPMLRLSPDDEADVEFVAPKIEGLFDGAVSWQLVQLVNVGITFVLFENE